MLLALVILVAIVANPAVVAGAVPIELFDANIRYASGTFVPLQAYDASTVAPFTTWGWTLSSRTVRQVAADGVSLLIVRAQLPRSGLGPVTIDLASEHAGADPGSLWAIDDQELVDRSDHARSWGRGGHHRGRRAGFRGDRSCPSQG